LRAIVQGIGIADHELPVFFDPEHVGAGSLRQKAARADQGRNRGQGGSRPQKQETTPIGLIAAVHGALAIRTNQWNLMCRASRSRPHQTCKLKCRLATRDGSARGGRPPPIETVGRKTREGKSFLISHSEISPAIIPASHPFVESFPESNSIRVRVAFGERARSLERRNGCAE